MVYNNLFIRSLISSILVLIYFFINIYNFEIIQYLILIIYIIILLEIFLYFKKYKIYVLFYCLFSLFFLLKINFMNENQIKFNFMIIIIISFDIFSYITGKLIGKHKLLPKISPKKTLEGFIGGFVLSFLAAIAYSTFFNYELNFKLLLFIFFMIIGSLIGDIIESYFKRINELKDSSYYLPGHGGFFDRFDSFIFTIIIYYFLNNII